MKYIVLAALAGWVGFGAAGDFEEHPFSVILYTLILLIFSVIAGGYLLVNGLRSLIG